jgi:type I restriction enzyme, S subunit
MSEIEVPEGWEEVKFSDYVELKHGYQFRDYDFTEEGIKVIKIGQLKQNGHLDLTNCSYISKERLDEFKEVIIKDGDILMALTGATLGKVSKVTNINEPIVQNYRVGNFYPLNSHKLLKDFFYNVFGSDLFLKQVFSRINQGAQPNVGKADFQFFKFLLPPLPEQEKIASILSKTDEQIELTEEIIAKIEELKKGLMRQLLTKGIGHTEFKETKSGLIPAEWNLLSIEDISELVTKGTTPTTYGFKYCSKGINFIKIESIDNNGIFNKKLFAHIDEDCNKYLQRSILKEKDILFSIAGALGRVAIVNKNVLPANINQALAIIRLKKEYEQSLDFIYYYLKSDVIKKRIGQINVQSAQANLSLANIKQFKIISPPFKEQIKISKIISTSDNQIKDSKSELQRLTELKKGLMQNLLIGKVRVKIC